MDVCIHCKEGISSPPVHEAAEKKPGVIAWHCVAYVCPMCHRMTSVQVFTPAPKRRFRTPPKVQAANNRAAPTPPVQNTAPADAASEPASATPTLEQPQPPAAANPAPESAPSEDLTGLPPETNEGGT